MNKAFVREPDEPDLHRCPQCEVPGRPVTPVTLEANLSQDAVRELGTSAFHCPNARCGVVYFDRNDMAVDGSRLARPAVDADDPDQPLCPCFGFMRQDVQLDLQEGAPTRTRALLARAQSPQAHCETSTIDGQSCVARVQQYYLKLSKG